MLCELVPGGVAGEITARRAARILDQVAPDTAATAARRELAAELLADLRRLDGQRRECATKLATAVRASGTSLTGLFGVGPVIAGLVIGDVVTVARFPRRGHFAACNGTAPVEVSSGGRKVYRLSLRGNRRLNHAIHMAAITQIRHKHSDGRACYDKKIAEGKTHKKRSGPSSGGPAMPSTPASWPTPGEPGSGQREGPGRATGERLRLQRGRLTPRTPALRTSHSRTRAPRYGRHPGSHTLTVEADFKQNPDNHLTAAAKRTRYAWQFPFLGDRVRGPEPGILSACSGKVRADGDSGGDRGRAWVRKAQRLA